MTIRDLYDKVGEWLHAGDLAGHFPVLYDLASHAKAVIEVGPGAGASSIVLLAGLDESGGKLWSVDIERQPKIDTIQDACPGWTFVLGESVANAEHAPYGVDVLFIDSAHTYDQTFAELTAYAPHVRPGGTILCHDTAPNTMHRVADALDAYGLVWTDDPRCNGLGRIDL